MVRMDLMAARNPAVAQAIKDAIGHPEQGELTRLAEAAGVGVSTASRWVSLHSSPDPKYWPAIESHLGMRAGTLKAAASRTDPAMRLAALEAEIAELHKWRDVIQAMTKKRVPQLERVDTQVKELQERVVALEARRRRA